MKVSRIRFRLGLSVLCIATLCAALGAVADGGSEHQLLQTGTIELGTSGGNIFDISRRFCCSGTLGALVKDGAGYQYILSNNHVLARSNLGQIGDAVSHPGMVDQNCGQDGIVAELTLFQPILFGSRNNPGGPNEVDAAIALVVTSGNVAADGSILDIGPVNSLWISETQVLGMAVQKSGRTSGLTTGVVSAISVDVIVGYSEECGGRASQFALFTNQIRITDGSFSTGGDSGSLIVEDLVSFPDLPRPVGLLFAGSSSSTIANPIGAVLASLGVTLVSGVAVQPPSGSISGIVTDAGSGSPASPIEGATVTVTDTGATATTDATGSYAILNVPEGIHLVAADAPGYESSATQEVVVADLEVSGVNFSLTPAVVGAQSLVACVIYNTEGGRNGDKHLLLTIRIVDDLGQPVSGAVVTVDLSGFNPVSGTTGTAGELTFTAKNAPNRTYVTDVLDVDAPGLAFEGSTPANSFVKGTDSVPAEFCNVAISSSPSGESSRPSMAAARSVKARNGNMLFSIPGVVGHGLALNENGQPVIEVYLDSGTADARARIPAALENVPVRVVVTGAFEAY